MYKPYTYLLGWSSLNKFYYGVRYAKSCRPEDLWVKYFTSSKHVKYFVQKHGNPDTIQIRKTFDDREKAIKWENTVLRRLKVVSNKKFLNATYNGAIIPTKFNRTKNLEKWNNYKKSNKDWYNNLFNEEQRSTRREKIRQRMKMAWLNGTTNSQKSKTDKYVDLAHKRWKDPNYIDLITNRKWMSNIQLKKTKMFHVSKIDEMMHQGWVLGRVR